MTKTYSYDASGNNTGIVATLASGGAASTESVTSMTYDGLNRMVSWSRAASGATLQTETHGYRGAEWHRRSTSANGVSTSFLYDGDNVLVDYVTTGGGGSTFDRLYVTPFLDQNLSMTLAAGASGNTSGSEQAYYYSQDGLGSVRTLTDATGMLVNNYDFLAFGETAPAGIHPSGFEAKEEIEQRYTYTGREKSAFDGQSAPMYYRYRHYAPGVGRFTARDPIGEWGGIPVYGYVMNRPLFVRDPFGLAPPFDTKITMNGRETTFGAEVRKARKIYTDSKKVCEELTGMQKEDKKCDFKDKCEQAARRRYADQLRAIENALKNAKQCTAGFETDPDSMMFDYTNKRITHNTILPTAAEGLARLGEIAPQGIPTPSHPVSTVFEKGVGEGIKEVTSEIREHQLDSPDNRNDDCANE